MVSDGITYRLKKLQSLTSKDVNDPINSPLKYSKCVLYTGTVK